MKVLNDYRLRFEKHDFLPIMIGGMGVNISSAELALKGAELGAIAHISDALSAAVSDKLYKTSFIKDKLNKFKDNQDRRDKTNVKFDLAKVAEATKLYVADTMSKKKGKGLVFINCMEKLTMNNPRETLKARLNAALDAGIDGISLSAGLHLSSFSLMAENARFRDARLGIIVSSLRAFKIFLAKIKNLDRLPDYVVVEGPLAGGHLGFGLDWAKYDLKTIFKEIVAFIQQKKLNIAAIPAGGIFTGTDAVEYMDMGASAVQLATRFTISKECGLPARAKQKYISSEEKDIYVSTISPTGYPMRILRTSPALASGIPSNCETYGYLLDSTGKCTYNELYFDALESGTSKKDISIIEKVCLCTHMKNYKLWTCGHYTYRLKNTTNMNPDGEYQLPSAEHIVQDYLFSKEHQVALPFPEKKRESTLAL